MAVALHDLRGDGRRLEPQRTAHLLLELGLDVGEGAHGARSLPTAIVARARRSRSRLRPASAYQTATLRPNARGLGVDAVRPADRERVLVAQRQHAERLSQPLLAGEEQRHGVPELQGGGGVPHVAGGQADVDEPRVVADLLLEARQERDHLVLDALLDGEDPADVDLGLLADARHRGGRDPTAPSVRLAHRQLHLEPRLVLRLLAPEAPISGRVYRSITPPP